MKNFIETIQEIISFSPRQLEGESKTAKYLITILRDAHIPCTTEEFIVGIPLVGKTELIVDGEPISCEGSCFESGEIRDKDCIISSLYFDAKPERSANINFNPQCATISLPVYYQVPAIAVMPETLHKILRAENVHGKIDVARVDHRSINILVGNSINPKNICFAHYDSIKMGAIDNASGVVVMMHIIENHPESLKDTLYVFAANEELSYDKDIYWGHGYREFEKEHESIMMQAQQIIVIDSVGNGIARRINNKEMLKIGFPIVHGEEWYEKIFFIAGDFAHLMTVYHSDDDDGRGMTEGYMQQAYEMVCDVLNI